ncbi:MAG: HlyD family efflux transporter periplasmic adaptor subunit [Planctomycetota bacterium]|nr:MAG: HlyD family efflux transporter periplasmic adaptor subunit [Planctomycetota bacterium]
MDRPSHPESVARSASLMMRVDGLLEHAETLGRTPVATSEYYGQVLGELAEILEAHSAAVWSVREDSVSLLFDTQEDSDRDRLAAFVEPVARLETDRTVIVPPGVGGRWPNATEFARCIACVSVAPSLRLALDVRLSTAAQRGENIADVVAAVAAVIVEFHRGRQLTRMFSLSIERDRIAGLCQALHSTLDRRRIALDLANDGATALRLDRVSVLLADEFGFRLESATAVQDLNRRANASRAIEQVVFEVRRQGTSLPWTSADQTDEAARAYLQESGATRVRVEPLGPKPGSWEGACGAVVFESFGSEPLSPDYDGVAEVCRHAATALTNAAAFEAHGLSGRLLRWKSLAQSRRSRTITVSIVGVVLALALIPADLELEAHGQVQPTRRRSVYAPADGIITRVAVSNAVQVADREPLAVMRNPELDLEEQRVRGEIATTNARLAAVRASRGDPDRRGSNSSSAGQLAADEEELKQTIVSLNRQLEIVNRRVAELTLRAPLAGQVVRWDLIRSLESRPVRQGQLLMQVVDPAGPWEIELRIPDRHVRHVLAAQAAAKEANGLPVRFLFRMSPKTTYSARLDTVNLATDLDQDGELSTFAKVTLNPKEIPDLRPGSSVIAKLDCGRRSLGYVWLRELLEFLQTRVLF